MHSAVLRTFVEPEHHSCTAEIVRGVRRLGTLGTEIERLVDESGSTASLGFFLASVCRKVWTPRVVAIRQRGKLIGALCAKERKFAGVPTGIIFADATLAGMVISEPAQRENVLHTATQALLGRRTTLGLRLLVPPDGYELGVLRSLLSSQQLDYAAAPAENHSILSLDPIYDHFLNKLGPRTRRNFRYYRRKSQTEGHVYVEALPLSEFRAAAEALLQHKVVGANANGMARAFSMFEHARRPILAGLRDPQGAWLGLLGGWFEGERPIVFFQVNSDKQHARSSLSLVLRGYFLEGLIQTGIGHVVFWAGVGEPLNRYAKPIPTLSVYVDKPQKLWSGFRHLLAGGIRKLPPEIAWRADWIAPNGPSATPSGSYPLLNEAM